MKAKQREREGGELGGKSVEIGRWNLHTSYDLRGDIKRLQWKRAASFTEGWGEGGKKVE